MSDGFFWKIVNKQLKIVNKHILALPMMGHRCFFQELQLFEIPNVDLGHPVPT